MKRKQLPKSIDEIFGLLSYEILLLHEKRQIFRELYYSGDETIKLLNFAAPRFFVIQRNMFINDILITMRRLIDPEESRSKRELRKNLSLDYLISRIDDSETKAEIEKLVIEAKRKVAFAKTISDKRIAHNDLRTKQKLEKLPDFNFTIIDEALLSIENVMTDISSCWNLPPMIYRVAGIGTGTALVNRVRQAGAYCDSLQEFLRTYDKKPKRDP